MSTLSMCRLVTPSTSKMLRPRGGAVLCHAQHAPNRRTAGLLLATAGFSVLTDCRAYAAAAAPACELTTTPSGLQFCDTKEGGGDEAQAGTLVRVHYDGRLESNGSKFDSSYDRGRPLTFKIGVGQVIKGWDIGITGSPDEEIPAMKAGGKRTLVIPAKLGYGERGAGGGLIPPGATLIFDVEYLGLSSARR